MGVRGGDPPWPGLPATTIAASPRIPPPRVPRSRLGGVGRPTDPEGPGAKCLDPPRRIRSDGDGEQRVREGHTFLSSTGGGSCLIRGSGRGAPRPESVLGRPFHFGVNPLVARGCQRCLRYPIAHAAVGIEWRLLGRCSSLPLVKTDWSSSGAHMTPSNVGGQRGER